MAVVCRECRRPKGHGHKMDCGRSYSRRNEMWIDSVSNRPVTDVTYDFGSDSSSSTSSDSGSCGE